MNMFREVSFVFIALLHFTVKAGWIEGTMDATWDLFSMHFPTTQDGWVVGWNGDVLKTSDGGRNWVPQQSGATTHLFSVLFTDIQTGWILGDGFMLGTTNGGQVWTKFLDCDSAGMIFTNDIYFHNTMLGYLVGYGDEPMMKTLDGGVNWSYVDIADHVVWFRHIGFINKDVGWCVGLTADQILITDDVFNGRSSEVVGRKNAVWWTHDGGTTWGPKRSASGFSTVNDVFFIDSTNGWLVAAQGAIRKTSDGGTTWTPQVSGVDSDLKSVWFTSMQVGWIAGSKGLLYTCDGGETWETRTLGDQGQSVQVQFLSSDTGFALIKQSVWRTVDGGSTAILPITQLNPVLTSPWCLAVGNRIQIITSKLPTGYKDVIVVDTRGRTVAKLVIRANNIRQLSFLTNPLPSGHYSIIARNHIGVISRSVIIM